MIDRLLRPHPNGLAIERPNGRPTISGSGWFPVLNLIWLVWVFVAPWLPGRADPQVLLLTATATPPVIADMQKKFAIAADDVVTTGFYRANLNQAEGELANAKAALELAHQPAGRLLVRLVGEEAAGHHRHQRQ